MNIHEYQAKALLRSYGIPVSDGRPVTKAEDAKTAAGELDGPLRELITLKYRDDHDTNEIAVRLKRSLVWVRVSLFRVRQQLRECIEAKLKGGQPC